MKKNKPAFYIRLFMPTPGVYKRYAKTFFSLSAAFGAAYGGVKALDINMPEVFNLICGTGSAISLFIATFCQQKIKKD